MPKLHVELDGPPGSPVAVLLDGKIQSDISQVALHLDAQGSQVISLQRVLALGGTTRIYTHQEERTITKLTLTIDYEEA